MKLFDLFGGLTLVTWVGIVAGFVHTSSTGDALPGSGASAQQIATATTAQFRAGHAWMILTREDQEVGFVHEARTEMDEGGWLLEHEMWMQIPLGAQGRLLRADTKAWVGADMALKQFRAKATSPLGDVLAKGEVQRESLEMEVTLAGKTNRFSLPLQGPPKLAQTALLDLISSPEALIPGQTYTRQGFDPIQAKIVPTTYTYIERKQTSSYETLYDTFHFRQQMLGQELDVYITPGGTVVIQEFPLRTAGALIPTELAKLRAQKIKADLQKQEDAATHAPLGLPATAAPSAQGIQGALKHLQDLLPPPKDPAP